MFIDLARHAFDFWLFLLAVSSLLPKGLGYSSTIQFIGKQDLFDINFKFQDDNYLNFFISYVIT
jgi:hypothetical protein